MARVRGSKQESLVVKPHRPLRYRLFLVGLTAFVVAALSISFLLGRQYERDLQQLAPGKRQQLEIALRKVTALERDRKVDKLAVETSRQTIKELELEASQLNKAVAFYRSVMAPESAASGLQVHDLGVEQLGQRRYRVAWVLAQVSKTNDLIQGKVQVNFAVTGGDGQRVLSLNEIAETEPNAGFKFRYFQHFNAVVNISNDLVVDKIEVVAESSGRNVQTVSREFDWLIQEKLADVGE